MDSDEDMPVADPAIWQQGFAIGAQSPARPCPFPRRSREARSWLLGWEQGIQQLLGHERHDKQALLPAASLPPTPAGQAG